MKLPPSSSRGPADDRSRAVRTYGKTVTLEAFVGTLIPSRTLGDRPIQVVITRQRSKKKMNVFFTTE